MLSENLINSGIKLLKKNKDISCQLDSEILLSNLLSIPREKLLIGNNLDVNKSVKHEFFKYIERRKKKEPIAYIIRKKEFWSLDFFVDKSILIPRPETELMVDAISKKFKNKNLNILDIGTGSGCILISLLKELKFARGIGIDVSKKAINIARKNSKKFQLLNKSKFISCSIDNFKIGYYDVIVSNPPYVPYKELKNLPEDVIKYEPIIALNGGIDGLDLIKKVIYKSNILLKSKGTLAIEIGNNQYLQVSRLLKNNNYREVCKIYDYKRNVRCIISTKI